MRQGCFHYLFHGLIATVFIVNISFPANFLFAQSVASGTIEGTVSDSSGGVVVGATAEIRNPVTGFQQTAMTDSTGIFRFTNVPFNQYQLQVTQTGFRLSSQDLNVRSTVTLAVKVTLSVADVAESVVVEAGAGNIVENVPYAHADVNITTLDKLPMLSPASGLSDAIVLSLPGVVADSNGFFHPLGDHAQTSFAIDGQPINDQQSKAFSTQVPVNAIQSMEVVTGTPNAEFGDKTSLVVNATTRSGLGLKKPAGQVSAQYSFFCGGQSATPTNGISSCDSTFGATRLRIPAEGTADADRNPARIAPRNILDIGVGTDNLFRRQDQSHMTLRMTVSNLTNKIALYNFHSTFSGTHFIAPRTYSGTIGFVF